MPTINGEGQATVFTRDELNKFFKVINSGNKKNKNLWYLLYKFLYYSGERSGCAIQTLWSDINFENNLINFRKETRKGKLARKPLNLHPELRELLLKHKPMDNQGFIFPGITGKTDHIYRITLDKHFKRMLVLCGFENKGFSLHSFRRTFVTRLYQVNKNVKECMAITGHNSVSAFMLYIDLDEDRIIETINSL